VRGEQKKVVRAATELTSSGHCMSLALLLLAFSCSHFEVHNQIRFLFQCGIVTNCIRDMIVFQYNLTNDLSFSISPIIYLEYFLTFYKRILLTRVCCE
jgi:hypothetical protein